MAVQAKSNCNQSHVRSPRKTGLDVWDDLTDAAATATAWSKKDKELELLVGSGEKFMVAPKLQSRFIRDKTGCRLPGMCRKCLH